MIIPSKTTHPADSLISIAAFIIEILKQNSMTLDELHDKFNQTYYVSTISIEQLILALDFLYITGKIKDNNEIITINIK